MTKKEAAAHAELIERLETMQALRWTEEVKPDVEPPKFGVGKLTRGFLFNAYNAEVVPACSSVTNHNYGSDAKTTTQGSRTLFSTRLRALKSLRHVMELNFAKELVKVDRMIREEATTTTDPGGDANE